MNTPPKEFIRVMPQALRSFVAEAFQSVGVPTADAAFLAELLVLTDLRGVFSHGTRELPRYLQMILDGKVNPRPKTSIVDDTAATAIIDGDGGMGHFAAHRAARMAVEKAKAIGLGAATSRNHFHIGGAGKYSRLALEENCVGFVVSAHRVHPPPEHSVFDAPQAAPMSFAIPSGREAPIVIDMANSINCDGPLETAFARMPGAFFKILGLGAVCHALGGFMAGIWLFAKSPGQSVWAGADQGTFVMAIDISRFVPMENYKRDIDRYIREIHQMQPAPGYEQSQLPGELEWQREREWAKIGVPIGETHRDALASVADQRGISSPF